MVRPLGYDYVKDHIEREGHSLLTPRDRYINMSQKLDIKCPDGHVYQQTFKEFKDRNVRCSDRSCIRERVNATTMARRAVECVLRDPTIKEKIKATSLARWGVENPF